MDPGTELWQEYETLVTEKCSEKQRQDLIRSSIAGLAKSIAARRVKGND